ncbi:MAG TPA: hypothetical protein VJ302_21800 [Blastocatellia bacterium]|nr:hypothetical protein [Blastocatellia bacterium]
MIICPSCGSSHIRNDYKPAPLTLRMVGIRALLCDHCNHQFRAFALTPPKSRGSDKPPHLADVFTPAPVVDLKRINQNANGQSQKQTARIILNPFPRTTEAQPTVTGELIMTDRRDLRTQITKLYDYGAKAVPSHQGSKQVIPLHPNVLCPECNSQNVRRRHRNGFERAVFSFIHYKAFTCQACAASFYARISENGGKSRTTNFPR